MTRRTRFFLVGAALILAVGLGTGLVAYYKGDFQLFRSTVGPAELAYVPPDATGLAYANVRSIMDSEFRQKLQEVLPTGEGKEEFFNQTGIDIERDIQSVLAAAVGPAARPEQGLLLIRGYFDEGRIEAMIRQHNGSVEDYKGHRLMLMPERVGPGPSLTFVETGLALFGSEALVKRAIDTHESAQNVTANTELMTLVGQVEGAGNTAWAVGGLEAVTNHPGLPPQVRDQLPGIEWMAVSARINGGLDGRLFAQARDDQAATDLRAVVNGALAAARLMGGQDRRFDPVLNSVQVTGVGRDVDLTFHVPTQVLDMIGDARRSAATPQ
jgi:hypothetical protein